jgi:molybdate transport system permease protein
MLAEDENSITLDERKGREETLMDGQAFWLTVRLSALVAAILVVIGLPLAYWITYSRWRWKFLAEAVFALPIVLPPTVLGFYVLVALGPHSPLGRGWEALTGHTLAFTFEGLVIGSIVYSLGASRIRTCFRVILPLSRSGLVTGVALSFAHTMGEFGVVLMVGGNIPGVTRTVSIDIYDKVQAVNYSGANATALILLAISFATLSVVYALNRRVWIWN